MRVKICGITKPDQGQAIAELGATALGFICVPASPRYVTRAQIRAVVEQLPPDVDRIGVFANTTVEEICQTVAATALTGVQLHGTETTQFCQQVRQSLPDVEIIKALRIKTPEDLTQADAYTSCIDTLLLDAYHPQMLGGTGKTLDWKILQQFNPRCPWLLAGGLTPENVLDALTLSISCEDRYTSTPASIVIIPHSGVGVLQPNENRYKGIDLSSGVELSPGDKDLNKVAQLFEKLRLANC